MDVTEHIDALHEQGELLAAAAEATGLDDAVPTCPEWQLRDLLDHLGKVHRWAATYVATGRTTILSEEEEAPIFGDPATDDALVDWFRSGHRKLCEALRTAPADLECWTFMPAPSPLAFWARRQAHETTIHRVDAESVGGKLTPVDKRLAADGIDELLLGFATRGNKLLLDPARTMAVQTTDTDDNWLVSLGPVTPTAERSAAGAAAGAGVAAGAADGAAAGAADGAAAGAADGADCAITGTASDVYLTLWNRLPTSALATRGDAGIFTGFCDKLHVRWS
jgi:uncharacterized protein (TIGR03083 family)